MPASPPPNVLLIVADDLPRNILGAYGAQHGLLPELDGLARRGLTFDSAYTVAPLCTPSRYALLTGSYASRGARDRTEDGQRNPARQVDFQVFLSHHKGAPPTHTVAQLLRGHGYVTGLIGKYHVGHSLQAADCGIGENGKSGAAHQPFVRASLLEDSKQRYTQSCQTIGNQSCMSASIRRHAGFDHVADVYYDNDALTFYAHQPEWMAHEALRFVRSARKRQKPFFLWMAPSLTHSPADIAHQLLSEPRFGPAGCGSEEEASAEVIAAFKAGARRTRASVLSRLSKAKLLCSRNSTEWRICPDEKLPSSSTLLHAEPWLPAGWFLDPGVAGAGRRAGLATSVALAAWLDASLAPLFAEVEHGKNGTDTAPQQTLTIFTSDHGPYFAGKGHAYEAGVRVPFIAHWFNGPASPGGRTIETRVTHLDVLPTLARLVGGAASTTTSMALAEGEGRAIESLLGGSESARQPSESSTPLFIEVGFSRSVVLNGYKLMVHLLPPSMATDALCRSIHGIKLPAVQNLSKASKIKFMYDVRDRHPQHHCDRVQLYDLAADPAEQRNLAAAQPERVETMRRLVLGHVKAVEAVASGT